jgi:hypothetical protein
MTSLWPAIVAAVAALAGVFLGQVFQAYRDKRTYERDLERDKRKNRVDAEARLHDKKLETYSDFLATLDEYTKIRDAINDKQYELGIDEINPRSLTTWEQLPLQAMISDRHRRLRDLHCRMQIVSGPTISVPASTIMLRSTNSLSRRLMGAFDQDDYQYWREPDRLRELMRDELRGLEQPTEVEARVPPRDG